MDEEKSGGMGAAEQNEEFGFRDACEFIKKHALTEKDKGALFERLIAGWLKTDPAWSAAVERVWLWEEFARRLKKELQPGIFSNRDMGIDIVAEMKGGQFWAFQCKCYAPDTVMTKAMVDSFVSECGKRFVLPDGEHGFSRGVWVHDGGCFGKNAKDALRGQRIPFTCISGDDLDRMEGIDWRALVEERPSAPVHSKEPREHQAEAIAAAGLHFAKHSRGRLIMACGTGKTFTSLKIVEQGLAGRKDGFVLFCVPSISLLGQTLNAWMAERAPDAPMHAVCVCSDAKVSKKAGDEDSVMDGVLDLAYPASTEPEAVFRQLSLFRGSGTVVVFSTYQSLEVVSEAQKLAMERLDGWGVFDFAVCDEAHRTTGTCGKNEEASVFTRIHDSGFIQAKKRLYMTATPRMYKTSAKQKAVEADTIVWSMDDEDVYGKEFYRFDFGKAVGRGELTDYKVLVLTLSVSTKNVPDAVRSQILDKDNKSYDADTATQLSGVVNAICKRIESDPATWDADPGVMKRGIVFCGRIGSEGQPGSSVNVASILPEVAEAVDSAVPERDRLRSVHVKALHVDGSMGADKRSEALAWLRKDAEDPQECRLLCNVRCLSEGIDVPALDAAIYLSPRRSQIDVVQSVGRVMRNFRKGKPGEKKYGYVILPVIVPHGVKPEDALNDNERFKAVWEVLNALRAHDGRFDAMINSIKLNSRKPDKICLGSGDPWEWAGGCEDAEAQGGSRIALDAKCHVMLHELLYARMVEKVGNRFYWDSWASSAGTVAKKLIGRMQDLMEDSRHEDKDKDPRIVFNTYMAAIRKSLNSPVSELQGMEMLAQSMITEPIFDALFPEYRFSENNSVSASMKDVVCRLEANGLFKETKILERYYGDFRSSVETNIGPIDNDAGRQEIVRTLYDKFFSRAFPLTVEKLGIVYTPVDVVDFVLHSADAVLKREFEGRSLADRRVNILDPFTGTGTFIARLLQTGLAGKGEDLLRKYRKEIFANELVLLAYYIADVNIENVFNGIRRRENPDASYERFEHIALTDTFSLCREDAPWARSKFSGLSDHSDAQYTPGSQLALPGCKKPLFQGNTEEVEAQQKAHIHVVIGNPPYRAGQKSAGDMARNEKYPKLDGRIEATYAAGSDATNKNSLYDSYIRAFRWASDRIPDDEGGIVAFVTNAGWLDGAATAGMRKCLEEEFASIYVVNLRGDQRTSGELSRREGGKIFGEGSRTPIAVTILVKKPEHEGKAVIRYYEVEDYMSREDKLQFLKDAHDVSALDMRLLHPDEHGDWLNHRDHRFEDFISIGDKKAGGKEGTVFCGKYSNGLKTQRDAWCWNFSKKALEENVRRMLKNYNSCVDSRTLNIDPRSISWSDALQASFDKKENIAFNETCIVCNGMYRPFIKECAYFSKELNERRYMLPSIFPEGRTDSPVICVSGTGVKKEFSCLMVDCLPDLELVGKTQCFPLRWFSSDEEDVAPLKTLPQSLPGMGPARRTRSVSLFEAAGMAKKAKTEGAWRNGVTDWIFQRCRSLYPSRRPSKEDIFYYVYGLLHSREYRQEFAADLKKSLPRIPFPDSFETFDAFSRAGRRLADIHLHYEEQEPWPGVQIDGAGSFMVEKPCWLDKPEKTALRLNASIVLRNVPARAHEYVVCGKSALDWLVERYAVRTDKDSGIVNDANAWAEEHGRERYVLDLFLSVITVCMKTLDIVDSLPRLVFGEDGSVMEEAPEAPEI